MLTHLPDSPYLILLVFLIMLLIVFIKQRKQLGKTWSYSIKATVQIKGKDLKSYLHKSAKRIF